MRVASIITDEEIVETGIIRYVLPSFRPPHTEWQISTCKEWNFQFREELPYSYNDILDNEESLFNYSPNLTQYIIGDGNCYFSTISYLITGSQDFHVEFRKLIIDNMLGDLSMSCNKYLRTKYVYTQGNYRNVQDWVNKTGMRKSGKWATDLEVFATALLFNIDIWVFLGPLGTRWIGFSGNGSTFEELVKAPTPNGIYIRNVGNHYEPIISVKFENNS